MAVARLPARPRPATTSRRNVASSLTGAAGCYSVEVAARAGSAAVASAPAAVASRAARSNKLKSEARMHVRRRTEGRQRRLSGFRFGAFSQMAESAPTSLGRDAPETRAVHPVLRLSSGWLVKSKSVETVPMEQAAAVKQELQLTHLRLAFGVAHPTCRPETQGQRWTADCRVRPAVLPSLRRPWAVSLFTGQPVIVERQQEV